ncbi:germ cell nuclear acidic protein-like [Rhinoderma darwinii]|uniref:germ cell nuclear acidic protein-like n=1 Tax=Rhinoderma darwinii TaxID=43563 RepID=UPI003F66534B
MLNKKRKRRFIIESDTEDSGSNDQLLVKKKCSEIFESDTEDSGSDENLHQSHPPIPRSPSSLEDDDGFFGPHLLHIESEPNSPFSFVQKETRRQERPINNCFLRDLTSPRSKYVTSFHQHKQELTRRLYKFYNQSVFDNKLPEHMDISWNKRLTKTFGRTGFHKSDEDRSAINQLSDKVCDSAERVKNTLIHEMCHAACWIIDGQAEDSHGWLWKSYCDEANLTHPELPWIKQYHNYEIHYPVVYGCSGCQFRVGRWTESLDTERFLCGSCHNKMVLLTKN